MSLGATLGSRFALMLTGRVVLLALSFVVLGLLTRALGPENFGYYRTAVAYLSLLLFIADFGLTSIFVREISRPGADQVRIVGSALVLRFAVAVVTLSGGVGLAFVLGFERPAVLGIVAGAAGFLAYSLHRMLFGLFQQKLRQQGVVIAEIVGGLALVGMVVVLIRAGAEPMWFVGSLGASYALTLLISLVYAHRLVPLRPAVDVSHWRELLRFALPVAATESLTVIYMRSDAILIALLHSTAMVGLHGVPAKVADAMIGVATLFVGMFAPLLARNALEPVQFAKHLRHALGVLFMGTMAVALMLAALAGEVVVLIGGAAFADAAPIMMVLGFFIVTHPANFMLREAAVALNVQRRVIPAYVIGTLTAFVCYVPLIRLYGGVGAAISLLVADAVVFVLLYRVLRSACVEKVPLRVPLLACLCGAAGMAVVAATAWLGWHWSIGAGAALAVYVVLLLATRALLLREVFEIGRGMLASRKDRAEPFYADG